MTVSGIIRLVEMLIGLISNTGLVSKAGIAVSLIIFLGAIWLLRYKIIANWLKIKIRLISRIFPFLWPNWPYNNPNMFTLVGGAISALALAYVSKPIVAVTGFYATILFFTNVFKSEVPKLDIEPTGKLKAPPSDLDDSDDDDGSNSDLLYYTFNLTNRGQKETRDLEIRYKIHRSNGENHIGWDTHTNSDALDSLKPTESESISLPVEVVEEVNDGDYFVQIKAIPGQPFRHLQTRYMERFP